MIFDEKYTCQLHSEIWKIPQTKRIIKGLTDLDNTPHRGNKLIAQGIALGISNIYGSCALQGQKRYFGQ